MSESLSGRIVMLVKSRDEVRVVAVLLIDALERASATILCLPMMCRMSVVNSEINDNFLLWHGPHESSDPEIVMIENLWSL